MCSTVREAVDALVAAVAALEPGTLSGTDAAALVGEFARGERICAAGVALCARRVEETSQWRREGHRSAAAHLAAHTGLGLGEAHGRLDVAHRLDKLPATAEAFRDGKLSSAQARAVADAGIADPASEQVLLDAAARRDLKRLKETAERVKAAARTDEMGHHDAIRRTRYLRRMQHPDGVGGITIRATNDDLASIFSALGSRTDAIFHEARRQGRREPHEAYALDALVDLCREQLGTDTTTTTTTTRRPRTGQDRSAEPATPVDDDCSDPISAADRALIDRAERAAARDPDQGTRTQDDRAVIDRARRAADRDRIDHDAADPDDGVETVVTTRTTRSGPKHTITVRADHAALARGHTVPGEICEIPGFGPIPVAVARAMTADASLTALVTDGTDVHAVKHHGRTIPADVHRALLERDGHCCVVCASPYRLEVDHYQVPFHQGGATELWNLALVCHHCHDLKTHRGFTLTGGPGDWRWHAPGHAPTADCCPVDAVVAPSARGDASARAGP